MVRPIRIEYWPLQIPLENKVIADGVAAELEFPGDFADAVKAAAERYLPRLDSMTQTEYDHYVTRASFFNATARTLEGFAGTVFRRGPDVRLPETMGKFSDDVDMPGTGLLDAPTGFTKVVRSARIERATICLEGRCSIQLSYERHRVLSIRFSAFYQAIDQNQRRNDNAFCLPRQEGRFFLTVKERGCVEASHSNPAAESRSSFQTHSATRSCHGWLRKHSRTPLPSEKIAPIPKEHP